MLSLLIELVVVELATVSAFTVRLLLLAVIRRLLLRCHELLVICLRMVRRECIRLTGRGVTELVGTGTPSTARLSHACSRP